MLLSILSGKSEYKELDCTVHDGFAENDEGLVRRDGDAVGEVEIGNEDTFSLAFRIEA